MIHQISINESLNDPQVLALTAQWLVVSKPSGWLTIPGRNPERNPPQILSEWAVKNYSPIWVVHRLDRETSGVVLFARTEESHRLANSWFQDRRVKKIYSCLASGIPLTPVFKVNEPVNGVHAITQVEVKECFQQSFLGKVLPRTGRRHQIRIHLSNRGHPILGDSMYRGLKQVSLGTSSLSVSRVALHAASLELPGGEVFEAPLPEDFCSWLDQLRKDGRSV